MTAAAALVALVALTLALRLGWQRRRAPDLPPPERSPRLVDVLVPMRDEAENVEECLAALLAQDVPVRILVLDDNSTDQTGELARRIGAHDPRVAVTTVPLPPGGSNGKVHALLHGASTSSSASWILALDADARPAPDALGRALAAARAARLDAISLAATQRAHGLGEALVTPPVFALLDALLGDWVGAAEGSGTAVANGQFLLVRRDALEAAGGYASILNEPLDDVALARRLAACGFRVGFWRAGEALEVRMYQGFVASFVGWWRNLGLILGARTGLILSTSLVVLLPALFALFALRLGQPLAALIAWGAGALASAAAREGTGSSPLWGLLYPLDALVLTALLLLARVDRALGRRPSWRGRTVAPTLSAVGTRARR